LPVLVQLNHVTIQAIYKNSKIIVVSMPAPTIIMPFLKYFEPGLNIQNDDIAIKSSKTASMLVNQKVLSFVDDL